MRMVGEDAACGLTGSPVQRPRPAGPQPHDVQFHCKELPENVTIPRNSAVSDRFQMVHNGQFRVAVSFHPPRPHENVCAKIGHRFHA